MRLPDVPRITLAGAHLFDIKDEDDRPGRYVFGIDGAGEISGPLDELEEMALHLLAVISSTRLDEART